MEKRPRAGGKGSPGHMQVLPLQREGKMLNVTNVLNLSLQVAEVEGMSGNESF
jgi:hypothetical protein